MNQPAPLLVQNLLNDLESLKPLFLSELRHRVLAEHVSPGSRDEPDRRRLLASEPPLSW